MTVTVQKTDGKIATVYWDVKSVEETPTFLKITGGVITLIPLMDILEVHIGDVENES